MKTSFREEYIFTEGLKILTMAIKDLYESYIPSIEYIGRGSEEYRKKFKEHYAAMHKFDKENAELLYRGGWWVFSHFLSVFSHREMYFKEFSPGRNLVKKKKHTKRAFFEIVVALWRTRSSLKRKTSYRLTATDFEMIDYLISDFSEINYERFHYTHIYIRKGLSVPFKDAGDELDRLYVLFYSIFDEVLTFS